MFDSFKKCTTGFNCTRKSTDIKCLHGRKYTVQGFVSITVINQFGVALVDSIVMGLELHTSTKSKSKMTFQKNSFPSLKSNKLDQENQ